MTVIATGIAMPPKYVKTSSNFQPRCSNTFLSEPAHVSSALEYQQKPPEFISAHTDLNAASNPSMGALANGVPINPLNPQRLSDTGMNVAGNNSNNVTAEPGIDFQSLLDNITTSASTAPSGPTFTATASSPSNNPIIQEQQPTASPLIPASADLPPRPPPQELPAFNFDYSPSNDFNDYHKALTQNANQVVPPYATHQQGGHLNPSAAPGVPPGSSSGANGLPPPPVATFQQQNPLISSEATGQTGHKSGRGERHGGRPSNYTDDEAPWPPDIQRKYDEFLRDERVYVTEGLWDRFPPGSRLFVGMFLKFLIITRKLTTVLGNLPTERVTKRDLFHLFHKYGKLAQISIKQAYGFIQFLDSSSCHQALQVEQGGLVRGRSIREFWRPQFLFPNLTGQQIWRYQSLRKTRGLDQVNPTQRAYPLPGVPDRRNSLVPELQIVVQPETRVEIATSAVTMVNGHHSLILEMTMVLLDVAMTTGHHQDRHPLAPFAVGREDIDQETERQIDSTDVTDVGRGLPMVGSDVFEVLALAVGRDMMKMFYAVHQEKFQTCRSWLLMMLTSKIFHT